MIVRVGRSGWNYRTGQGTWNGVFYPARRPRGFDELRYYAEHFDIVEVNSTFYRMQRLIGTVLFDKDPRNTDYRTCRV